MEFLLKNPMPHSQYAFPESMVSYPVRFDTPVVETDLQLTQDGQPVLFQLSEKQYENSLLVAAKVSFITDLPEGSRKLFVLEAGTPVAAEPIAALLGDAVVLQNQFLSLNIGGEAPVFTISQGSAVGIATTTTPCLKDVMLLENGPVFARVRVALSFPDGGQYVQILQVNACDPYVLLEETMELNAPDALDIIWYGLEPEYRIQQRHNSGVDYRRQICPWLPADTYTDDDGLIRYVRLLPYESTSGAAGTRYMSFLGTEFAAAALCTDAMFWNDGTYTIEAYDYRNLPTFYCKYQDGVCNPRFHYPLGKGTRKTALCLYPRQWEQMDAAIFYIAKLYYHTSRVPLDRFKDWILELPLEQTSFPRFFDPGRIQPELRYGLAGVKGLPTPQQLVDSIVSNRLYVNPLLCGACYTRIFEHWVPAYDLLASQMTEDQFRFITSLLLFGAYCCETEDAFPIHSMLGGHPNFLLDFKNCVGMCSALFPEHPHALRWKLHYEKAISRLLKYHIRPAVKAWGALGGRYTENYGTYLWGSMKHGTEATMLLTLRYGDNPALYPQLEELGNWIVNFMTAPLEGRRTILYSGAHAGCHERNPFYPLWNVRALGLALRRYNPNLSQQLLAICPPEEHYVGHENFCDGMDEDIWSHLLYKIPGWNDPGLEPELKSTKFTGYGFGLRSHVGQPDEMHVFLQQLDEGPNYRWGRAAWGGCGHLHYHADGKRYSGLRKEDCGDDHFRDEEVGCTFCVLLDHTYHTVGQNDLIHPLANLDFVQYVRADAGSYSNAEYRFRSVMMVDNRYIVIYDAVRDEHTEGRFIWNNFVDEPMPAIHQLIPGVKPREVSGLPLTVDGAPRYPAVRQDKDTRGVIYDGYGDFLTLVTHREEIQTQVMPYGVIVREGEQAEYIINPNAYAKVREDGVEFAGKVGFARRSTESTQLALMDGQFVGMDGHKLTRLGGSGMISLQITKEGVKGRVCGGITVKLEAGLPGGSRVYQNGKLISETVDNFILKDGFFQITAQAPVPEVITGLCYVNTPQGVQFLFNKDAFAEYYEVQTGDGVMLSCRDNTLLLTEAKDRLSVRVRGVSAGGPGPWSDRIMVVPRADVPERPEGLRVMAKDGCCLIRWGRLAGISGYKLYRNGECISEGPANWYFDAEADDNTVYHITAVNGYGEGPASLPRDARPDGPAYFDPEPEVRFQRNTYVNHHGFGGFDYVYNENRKILTYPE